MTGKPRASVHINGGDTLHGTLNVMSRAFADAGIETAATDARFLLQGVLQLDAATIFGNPHQAVGGSAGVINQAIERRLRCEPISRILGKREFYGRTFLVTPDVLDPRADTEVLIDLILATLKSNSMAKRPLTIADVGVGSGAIIATLLAELSFANGIATDISAKALAVALANSSALGVADRLTLVETRGLQGITERFDVLISNPPYIPTEDIAGLAQDVAGYDPRMALDGGPDGLTIYRELARDISDIAGRFWVFLEVGAGQVDDVEHIFAGCGAIPRHRRADLGGHIRAVALEIQH